MVGDFDGNGKSDLFWYNSNTQQYQIWLMDGVQLVKKTSGKIESGGEVAIADFNNDNRTDLFWRNPTTGNNAVWTFDPKTLAIQSQVIESKSPTWSAEIIDFNGDGRSDIYLLARSLKRTESNLDLVRQRFAHLDRTAQGQWRFCD